MYFQNYEIYADHSCTNCLFYFVIKLKKPHSGELKPETLTRVFTITQYLNVQCW